MRTFALPLAVLLALLGVAWWFGSGGSPHRAPAAWLTERDIAHRGLWSDGAERPENSLAAFDAAASRGNPIELDVQLTPDGVVVVFHDYDLERLTGTKGRLTEKTRSELRPLRLHGGSEPVPELTDVLKLVKDRVPIFVEIKNEGTVGALEDAVAQQLSAYRGRVAVMSFNPYSLSRVAKTAPQIQRGQLSSAFRGEDLAFYEVFLLSNLLMNWTSKPDFVAYDINELPNLPTRIQKMRGRPLIGWTVDTPTDRERLQKYCDAFICNEAGLR